MSTNYIEKVLRMQSSSFMGYWPLNEESGTAVYDLSRNGYNGTSSGLVRVPETRGFTGPDGGRCAQFDGSASYVDVFASASGSSISVAEGTVSVWVATPDTNLEGTTKMQIVLLAADSANSIGIDFDTTANRFGCIYYAGSGDATYSTTYGSLAYNVDGGPQKPEWQHLAMTYSAVADKVIFYINGNPSTIASSLGTWTGAFGSTITCIGTSKLAGADLFTGWMAHPAWWKTPFSEAEVRELAVIGP